MFTNEASSQDTFIQTGGGFFGKIILRKSQHVLLKIFMIFILLALMAISKPASANHHTLECNCVLYSRTLADGIGFGLTYYNAKKKLATKSSPKVGYTAVLNTAQPYGHVAVITKMDAEYIYVKHANWKACKIRTDKFRISDKRIYGYIPSKLKKNATPSSSSNKRACNLKNKYKVKAERYKKYSIKYYKRWLKSRKSSDLRRNKKHWARHLKYISRYQAQKKLCP